MIRHEVPLYSREDLGLMEGPDYRIYLTFAARTGEAHAVLSDLNHETRERLTAIIGKAFGEAVELLNGVVTLPTRRENDMITIGAAEGQNP